MKNEKKDLRLYVLMRNDLASMSPGRCMAQSSHAANALIHEHGNHPLVKEWQKQTKQGFGTCIVLAASKNKIDELFDQTALKVYPLKGQVIDPDYVIRVSHEVAGLMHQNYDAEYCDFKFDYTDGNPDTVAITRKVCTCAYVLGTKENLSIYLGELPLY